MAVPEPGGALEVSYPANGTVDWSEGPMITDLDVDLTASHVLRIEFERIEWPETTSPEGVWGILWYQFHGDNGWYTEWLPFAPGTSGTEVFERDMAVEPSFGEASAWSAGKRLKTLIISIPHADRESNGRWAESKTRIARIAIHNGDLPANDALPVTGTIATSTESPTVNGSMTLTAPTGNYVAWYKDGEPVTAVPGEIEGVNTSTLRFIALTDADSGTYTCRYEAPDGNVVQSEPFVLTVAEKPLPVSELSATATLLGTLSVAARLSMKK